METFSSWYLNLEFWRMSQSPLISHFHSSKSITLATVTICFKRMIRHAYTHTHTQIPYIPVLILLFFILFFLFFFGSHRRWKMKFFNEILSFLKRERERERKVVYKKTWELMINIAYFKMTKRNVKNVAWGYKKKSHTHKK